MRFTNNEPIAIVGTACRFPGKASTPSKLWDLLNHPRDLSSEIPVSRFNPTGFYYPDGVHHGTSNVRKSYFLEEDVRRFDSQFFNISTAEADQMDPQQRQLLEVVFEAMESANLTMEQMRGSSTAVYVGLMCDDYSGLIFSDMESVPTYGATGAARSILSNRVSYFYDWTGPSYTIDSACSSSLVAVHQAVQQLRSGECSVALAAGANLILSPRMFIAESKLNMLSPNGRSRMWDANGDGYARGEGIAAVLLKRLSDAIADGDHVECIIRETHVNQGGRSTGLTVPNPVAQVDLIRKAYAKAGLDLSRAEDRPQYFQAHGTGTKVGDLNEATAIHNTFFTTEEDSKHADLYIGSVKTVIGHSEGAAGIAGLLEACLAVQHGVIPPNLHFEALNPKLEPFYHHLEVPTEAKPWPLTHGGVRRASVNSFGFGGTNAHAILENYVPATADAEPVESAGTVSLPFIFSAASDRSLGSLLSNYSQYLSKNPGIDLKALAWTLTRRSTFTHKLSFAAPTVQDLCSKLDLALEERAKGSLLAVASRPLTRPKSILGVFTGQGAQWAAMGWDIISASLKATETFDLLEQSLASLPSAHRPGWSLKAELSAMASTSRISEAAMSQPLCTAIQIIIVDHLREAGIQFSAVVGHSSGEIGAAYAAGFLSADAAIKIAYYRGYFAKLAGNGKAGAMLAVGISMNEAEELCQLTRFQGRISVAASNSSTSVTLSGNSDAIQEAKLHFDEKSIFAKVLKVDTAYHSSHMMACSGPYLQALEDCDIQIQHGSDSCVWFSSVNKGKVVAATDALKGTYWMANMLQPVLFSQALSDATNTLGVFDYVLEVGPHPALKGPALQTLQEHNTSSKAISYSGLLARGRSGIETFAETLGSMWMHFGSSSFNADAYDKLFNDRPPQKLLKGLPTYPWDHERVFWYESRGSREFRLRSDPPHQLLGIVASDQVEGEHRWRNYLRLNEIPWLAGHKIQGQTIFPAAGYVVMALEAARLVARGKEVPLVEIQDLKILQAISINDDAAGVETLFGVKDVKWDEKKGTMLANFTCHACLSKDTGSFVLVCSGQLVLRVGEPILDTLPGRTTMITDLRDVDVDGFYESLADVGYGYTGPFRAISSLQQKLDVSTGRIEDANFGIERDEFGGRLMMHPASLDAAIQTLFACLGTPGDGSLWSMHVPVSIRRVRINPLMCSENSARREMYFDARIMDIDADKQGVLRGDIMLYRTDAEQRAILQMEGIEVKSLMPATPADDRHLFYELAWGVAEPDANLVFRTTPFTEREMGKAEVLEKICLFYFQQLDDFVKGLISEETGGVSWHGKQILASAKSVLDATGQGRHPTCKAEWLDNTWEHLQAESAPYASDTDFKLMHVVGSKLIPFIRNETTILEHMMYDGLLNSFYQNSELLEYNEYAGKLAAQIAFRYPLIKVLEIGAGTGGVTRAVLRRLDNKYSSYTFTDISVAFFDQAKKTFTENTRMIYESLDIETDPTSQGFEVGAYDLIVASNVLHATKHLSTTLSHVRKLLKPGGKLLVLEAVDNGCVRVGFGFCGVPGWWAAEDGRVGGPLVTVDKWEELLRGSGFGGLDAVTPGAGGREQPVAVFVATAVDQDISLLRDPLSHAVEEGMRDVGSVVIVGGATERTQDLIRSLRNLLEPWSHDIRIIESLDGVDTSPVGLAGGLVHVLNLTELDAPFFKDITPGHLEHMKSILNISRSFIWVTSGARSDNPYSSMVLGMGRTLVHEMPHARVQVLDLGDEGNQQGKGVKGEEVSSERARLLAQAFLRVVLVDKWGNGVGEGAGGRVWSNEVELWLRNGKWEVTRVSKERRANARLMSGRRAEEEVVDIRDGKGEAVDVIVREGGAYELQKHIKDVTTQAVSDNVQIRVAHSTLLAMIVGDTGYLHLIIGEMAKDGTKVIALAKFIGSTVSTPACWTLPWDIVAGQEAPVLSAMSWDIVAKAILETAKRNKTLVLFEPNSALANTVIKRAQFTSTKLCFVTVEGGRQGSEWVHIHPFSSDYEIKRMLPKDVASFVDCSASGEVDSSDLVKRVKSLLPVFCMKIDSSNFLSRSSMVDSEAPLQLAGDVLRIVAANAISALLSSKLPNSLEVISANMLSNIGLRETKHQLVNWTVDTKVRVRVQSAEDMMRFKNNRTYLLIGLSGNLGRSLCRWMIIHGARHIVLTSRKPYIDQAWLDEMKELGGEVNIMAMDVSNQTSLESIVKTIEATLPPIAGVANAAMVLSDTLLANMSFEEMQTVLKPKVDGSRFLSALFPYSSLDFFILFGSSVDIMGNSGQAAYCAANMFMHGLVCERRKKGLVGSLIGLGEVKGVGYAARRKKEGGGKLNRIIGDTLPLSEREVLAMFAEGVLAGQVGKCVEEKNPVLYAGMVGRDPRRDKDVSWYEHAKFWHYIETSDSTSPTSSSNSTSQTESLNSQLSLATSITQVHTIVLEAFIQKLKHKLQISNETAVDEGKVLLELGIDSLVAVDLRAWFVVELGVDIPILKILGGGSVGDVVGDAVGRLEGAMVPLLEVKGEQKQEEVEGVLMPNGLGGMVVVQPVVNVDSKEEVKGDVSGPPSDVQELEKTPAAGDIQEAPTLTLPESTVVSSPMTPGSTILGSGEVTTTSDSEGEAVLVQIVNHAKKESVSSTSSFGNEGSEEGAVFSMPASPTFSYTSSFGGDGVVGLEVDEMVKEEDK